MDAVCAYEECERKFFCFKLMLQPATVYEQPLSPRRMIFPHAEWSRRRGPLVIGLESVFLQKLLFHARRHVWPLRISAVRRAYWRLLGMGVGGGTKIGAGLIVTWPHRISIGERCSLEHGVYLNAAGGHVPGVVIVLGDGTFVGSHCEFNAITGIRIGKNCLIASGTRFIDHNHGLAMGADMKLQEEHGSPITLGSDVWVGANSIILKGVSIGDGAVIAAGSVVTKPIPSRAVAAGVPARVIRSRSAVDQGPAVS